MCIFIVVLCNVAFKSVCLLLFSTQVYKVLMLFTTVLLLVICLVCLSVLILMIYLICEIHACVFSLLCSFTLFMIKLHKLHLRGVYCGSV